MGLTGLGWGWGLGVGRRRGDKTREREVAAMAGWAVVGGGWKWKVEALVSAAALMTRVSTVQWVEQHEDSVGRNGKCTDVSQITALLQHSAPGSWAAALSTGELAGYEVASRMGGTGGPSTARRHGRAVRLPARNSGPFRRLTCRARAAHAGRARLTHPQPWQLIARPAGARVASDISLGGSPQRQGCGCPQLACIGSALMLAGMLLPSSCRAGLQEGTLCFREQHRNSILARAGLMYHGSLSQLSSPQ